MRCDCGCIRSRADWTDARTRPFVTSLQRAVRAEVQAFARARRRLIVVCARTLLEHIPPELEQYQAAVLWKSLRSLCSEVVAECHIAGHCVAIARIGVSTAGLNADSSHYRRVASDAQQE